MDFDVKETNFGKVLASILTGKVDRSMLDSGGIYGTSQGYNQKKVKEANMTPHEYFESTPESNLSVHSYSYDGTVELYWSHNIYWWLQRQDSLTYTQKTTERFYDFVDFLWAHDNKGYLPSPIYGEDSDGYNWKYRKAYRLERNQHDQIYTNYGHGIKAFFAFAHSFWPDEPQDWDEMDKDEWQYRMDIFAHWCSHFGVDKLYEFQHTMLTSNHENMLTQDFQYVAIQYDGDFFVGISIHGGCDIRGGYHDTFICKMDDLPYLFGDRGSIYCNDCGAYWDTYDAGTTIESYDYGTLTKEMISEYTERDEEGEVTGRLRCPHCENGILHGGI